MKKTLLALLIVALAGVSSFAQLSGGLKAGVNIATQKYSLGGDSESFNGTSFHIGAYGNFALSDALSIQPEVLYSSLKFDTEDLIGDDITTTYISVPVMLIYGFAQNKFNLQVGPQIGFLISTDPSELKDADYYSGTDFSLNFGAGANFGKFNITLRYGLGLGNVAGDLWSDIDFDDMEIKNNNLQISVGYKLFGE
jgi:hypothetical protein